MVKVLTRTFDNGVELKFRRQFQFFLSQEAKLLQKLMKKSIAKRVDGRIYGH